MDLEGQIALVTGSGRGIGAQIVKTLSDAGATVCINIRKNTGKAASKAEILYEQIRDNNRNAQIIQADITKRSDITKMFENIKQKYNRLDILVLNAAVAPFKKLTDMTKSDWKTSFETNILGNSNCITEASKLMNEGSSIITLSSIGSLRTLPKYPMGIMKSSLESLTRYYNAELAPMGIRVNSICAGIVESDIFSYLSELWPDMVKSEKFDQYLLQPEDVANVTKFLCHPDSSSIRGQVIVVDKGYSTSVN